MAQIIEEESRTFSEYLLLPNLTTQDCIPSNVSLRAPLSKYKRGEKPRLQLHIPLTSAIMQAVSDDGLAIALARQGGLSFVFGSQSIESQARMIRTVKQYKAGIVRSECNLKPDATLEDVLALKAETGHSTVAVTADGKPDGLLLGIVGSRDYRISRLSKTTPVSAFMTPFEQVIFAYEGTTLKEANDLIWENKLNQLPILTQDHHLIGLVFRKDYEDHKEHPEELLDAEKRLLVGAGINTRDYKERVPALVEAGADLLCIDSSDGFSAWQGETLRWIREQYGDQVLVGAGNVVEEEGFRYLVEAGADFVKIGIGGGSICITREQKGIGCGQASAVQRVSAERDRYFQETGIYVPLCSDGGLVYDYQMTLALAMGADFLMLGRYFARFDESPSRRLFVNGSYVKEYWGEGSNRARNWQRYHEGDAPGMVFEEGVDSYVPYAGSLEENVHSTLTKMRATFCSCGAKSIPELQEKARMIRVSSTSLVEGGAHDVWLKENKQRT